MIKVLLKTLSILCILCLLPAGHSPATAGRRLVAISIRDEDTDEDEDEAFLIK